MNMTKRITSVIMLLTVMLVFCSCGKELPGQPPKSEDECKDFIVSRYNEACRIYEIFDVMTLTGSGETVEVNGSFWSPADTSDPSLGFTDYSGLYAKVESLFSSEISSRLIGLGLYRDIDGKLYTMDAARGTDIFVGEVTGYEVTENGKDSYTLTVTYNRMSEDDPTVIAGSDSAEFVYGVVDGAWVFTQFELYY